MTGRSERQAAVISGLRESLAALGMQVEPPDGHPETQMAYLSGALAAVCDAFATSDSLYSGQVHYAPNAASGYLAAMAAIDDPDRIRTAMAFRLLANCAVIHPVGLKTAVDAQTAAAHSAMLAASVLLRASLAPARFPRDLLQQSVEDLLSAAFHTRDFIRNTEEGGQ